MKRNNEDVQIYLSRHVKARNLGINDIEIIDKKCGTIGVKRDQIYTRLARLMGREKRIENTCSEIWHVILMMNKKENMLMIG